MQWRKLGLVIEPAGYPWMVTHAQNPFPEALEAGRYRIHFAGRDATNRARGGAAILDLREPAERLQVEDRVTLDLGVLGAFDDCGVMPSCIAPYDGAKYMYYTGWSKAVETPFTFFIGLAISQDGGATYRRYSQAPVLGRGYHDPFLTASPWVVREGDRWRMWYVSCTGWDRDTPTEELRHYYHIRYAESADGIRWEPDGRVCIDFAPGEYAIARPVVYHADGHYHMWYCYRGGSATYRAGYAVSHDGLTWERRDAEVGIDVSPGGWDAEMICYPCVFEADGATYMLYNGNAYGATGTGLAVRM